MDEVKIRNVNLSTTRTWPVQPVIIVRLPALGGWTALMATEV